MKILFYTTFAALGLMIFNFIGVGEFVAINLCVAIAVGIAKSMREEIQEAK